MQDPRLTAAYQDFLRRTQGLTGHPLKMRLLSIANRPDADPFTRSLAQQRLDLLKGEERIEAMQAELKELRRVPTDTRYPGQPNKQAELAQRREELAKEIEVARGRLILLAQDPMFDARKKAVATFNEAAKAAERTDALKARVEQRKQAAEDAELDAVADRVIAGRSVAKD